MKALKLLAIICIIFLGALTVNALNITTDKEVYNYGDQVYFTTCEEINTTVSCLDSELKTYYWNSRCNLHAFETTNLSCYNPTITAIGTEEIVTKKLIITNKSIYRCVC